MWGNPPRVRISIREPNTPSVSFSVTALTEIGFTKDGQPVPESYLSFEEKSGSP